MTKEVLCIFGDSITYGYDDLENSGWVNRLRNYTDNEIRKCINIYNLGIPGINTDDLLKRVESECKFRKPTIIVFAIGINDSRYNDEYGACVPIDRFCDNLNRLIDISKKYTSKIVFIGLTNVNEENTISSNRDWNYSNQNVTKYDKKIEAVAMEKNVRYISLFDKLDKKDLSDGLHPDANGHEKMFQIILPKMRAYFK